MSTFDVIELRKRATAAQVKAELLELEQKRRLRDELLRTNFVEFTKQTFKTVSPAANYNHNWHIEAICEYLEACRRGEIRRLVINMPPRSMKSITCTVGWPAWLLGHEPGTQIIAGSYAARLAQKHSLDTQLVMGSRWYGRAFPNVMIDPRQADKTKFVTTERGHRLAVSTGSQATGEGADFVIIDDPTNPAQAASDTERQTANDWFDQTITSRQNDKNTACMVVVMQRLHEDDLSGHILEKGSWEHLNLQAKAEAKRTISIGNFRKVIQEGELLDPVRLSQEILDETLSDMGAYAYAGQYQQNPAPDEGGILKKKFWRKWLKPDAPTCDYIIQTLDTAFEEGEENDYSVITTWGIFMAAGLDGKDRASVMLLNCVYDHWSYPDLKMAAIKEYRLFKPDKVIIEKKASGMPLLQDLRKMGYPVSPFHVAKDKVYRANIASPVLEKGHVFFMDRDWAKKVIKECAVFPNGSNDDIVDTCLRGDTMIFTDNGLKQIEDIKVGDKVLTHKGRYRKVMRAGSRQVDSYHHIQAENMDPVMVTGEHPFLAAKVTRVGHAAKGTGWPEWVEAANLIPTKYKAFVRDGKPVRQKSNSQIHHALTLPILRSSAFKSQPIPKGTGNRTKSHADEVLLCREAGWLFGLFVAEGSVSNGKTVIACDEKTIRHLQQVVLLHLGWDGQVVEGKGCWRLQINSVGISKLFSTFGHLAENKIIPEWCLTAPLDFKVGFMDGWALGDGHRHGNNIKITTTSRTLAEYGKLLALSAGIKARVTLSKQGGKRLVMGKESKCLPAYALSYQVNPKNEGGCHIGDKYACFDLIHNEIEDKPITVYNLHVDGDESYVTTSGVVHNCTMAWLYLRKRFWLQLEEDAALRDTDLPRKKDKRGGYGNR